MNRRIILIGALVGALSGLPGAAPVAADPEPDFISVNPRGTVPVEHDGDAFVWTADLFSLTTFEKIGTFTDRATCATSGPPPCLVYDITTTFRVPGGEVVNRGLWSLTPDSTRPGFFLSASRPQSETILSGTGRFAGRTGRVNGWGIADLTQFPNRIGLDFRTLIRFGPSDANVLGTHELILGKEQPGADRFQTELFHTEGVNESNDPGHYLIHTPLFSLADGTRIGTATDSFACGAGPPPCQVLDGTATLEYPDGTVTAHFEIPFAPDPARPGFYLFGSRPSKDNIVSATGAYAGRTGKLSVSGDVDMRHFPSPIPYEGVGIVIFNK